MSKTLMTIITTIILLCFINVRGFAQRESKTTLRLQTEDGPNKSIGNIRRMVELIGENHLSNPYDFAAHRNFNWSYKAYVTDPEEHVVKMGALACCDGDIYIGTYGSQGTGNGQLNNPHGIASRRMRIPGESSEKSYITIADTDNGRVVLLKQTDAPESFTIEEETYLGNGILISPMDVDISNTGDPDENVEESPIVWVTDPGGKQILAIRFNGTIHRQIKRLTNPNPSSLPTIDDLSGVEGIAVRYNPSDLTNYEQVADFIGKIYVTDVKTRRVYLINPGYISGTSCRYEAYYQFPPGTYPISVSCDIAGDVWVTDYNSGKLYKFTPDLEFLATFGRFGMGDHQFNRPKSAKQIVHSAFFLVSEAWTMTTGFKSMRHGVDIFDVNATVLNDEVEFNFTLTDRCDITLTAYDLSDGQYVSSNGIIATPSGAGTLTLWSANSPHPNLEDVYFEIKLESTANNEPLLPNSPIVMTKTYRIIQGNAIEVTKISNQVINTGKTYDEPNAIIAGPNFTIVSPGDVTFISGIEITLIPGFTAQSGSNFLAVINGSSAPMAKGSSNKDEMEENSIAFKEKDKPELDDKSKNTDGDTTQSFTKKVENKTYEFIPIEHRLFQNYPNPFNPETTIKYGLPEAGFVTIRIYNMLGQEVRTLMNGHQSAGFKSIVWNGKNNFGESVRSGVYLYQMIASNFVESRKMVLLK